MPTAEQFQCGRTGSEKTPTRALRFRGPPVRDRHLWGQVAQRRLGLLEQYFGVAKLLGNLWDFAACKSLGEGLPHEFEAVLLAVDVETLWVHVDDRG